MSGRDVGCGPGAGIGTVPRDVRFQGRKDPAPTYCPSAVVDLTPSPIRCPWVRMFETARRPNAKTSAPFSCVHVATAEVTLSRARDRFLRESVPTEFLILQQRSSTMAKKAKKATKKKAKKKK